MLRWFGEQLKERTGDSDITFKEVSEISIQGEFRMIHARKQDIHSGLSQSFEAGGFIVQVDGLFC